MIVKRGIEIKVFDSFEADEFVFFPEEEGDGLFGGYRLASSGNGEVVACALLMKRGTSSILM